MMKSAGAVNLTVAGLPLPVTRTHCFFLGLFFKCEQSNHVNIFTICMLFIFKGNRI